MVEVLWYRRKLVLQSYGRNLNGLHVRQNEIQGCNMVFFKAHAYSISFCLTWSMALANIEFSRITGENN